MSGGQRGHGAERKGTSAPISALHSTGERPTGRRLPRVTLPHGAPRERLGGHSRRGVLLLLRCCLRTRGHGDARSLEGGLQMGCPPGSPELSAPASGVGGRRPWPSTHRHHMSSQSCGGRAAPHGARHGEPFCSPEVGPGGTHGALRSSRSGLQSPGSHGASAGLPGDLAAGWPLLGGPGFKEGAA